MSIYELNQRQLKALLQRQKLIARTSRQDERETALELEHKKETNIFIRRMLPIEPVPNQCDLIWRNFATLTNC